MKKLLFVLGGGIGNIVQATPSIKLAFKHRYIIELYLTCNSTDDLEIFRIKEVNKIYTSEPKNIFYDYQLQGPFTPRFKSNCKKIIKSKINYAQHIEEAFVYKSLIEQIGIKENLGDVEINIGKKGKEPLPNSVAIYCGSKPNWAMKRWDKYDFLSNHFESVVVVGTEQDINSHGNPSWIKRKWNWPKHVKFLHGKLQEVAYTISKCKMFIGNDGGLSHVAAATGVKTFVLFGPSSYIKNKPFSKNAHAIGIDIPCRPCQFKSINGIQIFGSNKASCPFEIKCMKDMSVEFVLKEIKKWSKE
jgi:hypothetical protein